MGTRRQDSDTVPRRGARAGKQASHASAPSLGVPPWFNLWPRGKATTDWDLKISETVPLIHQDFKVIKEESIQNPPASFAGCQSQKAPPWSSQPHPAEEEAEAHRGGVTCSRPPKDAHRDQEGGPGFPETSWAGISRDSGAQGRRQTSGRSAEVVTV